MDRPVTTLFMLMSVDGKISTGSTDEMDVDKDFPKIDGVKEGLHQYYEIEQTTDLWAFIIPVVFRQRWVSIRKKCLRRHRFPLLY